MRIEKIKAEFESFLQAYAYGENKDPLKNTLKGKPKAVKMNISAEFRDAVADALQRLNKEFAAAKATELDYPKSLYLDLGFDPMDMVNMSDLSGLDFILDSCLTEREGKIIRMRYQEHMTLEACGKVFGVTRDRIRQVQEKALRKMRHPAYRSIIREGKEAFDRRQEARGILKKATEEMMEEVERIKGDTQLLREIMNGDGKDKAEPIIRRHFDKSKIDIEELGFSVRAYNCLKRAGYNVIGDMIGVSMGDLIKVRNLGRKCCDEVVTKLREYGIEVSE